MEIPEHLVKKINNKSIVIFVGAGLSCKMGYPDWNSLLIKILEGISNKEDKSAKYIQALKDDILNPFEILDKISIHKTASIEILEEVIRSHEKTEPSSIHKKLGQISSNIITTNYDNLLEKALPEYEQIIYTNDFKVAKLSKYSEYIFKMHGDIQEPHKCILFPSEYENLYSLEEKTSTFEFKKIISDKTILFVGFSLSDPYVRYVFDYISKLYSGFNPEHYIITTEEGKNWPKNINPILISDHDYLESCIDKLIDSQKKSTQEDNDFKEELKQHSGSPIIKISESHEYDSPPNNKFWVGRTREIDNISSQNFKAIFITGIGGQGKSALAAHYIRNYFDTDTYEFADWRDFKEEANRFQTKIISILKRLSINFNFEEIESLNNEELIDTFFQILNKRKIIFVFDNIDNYIDLETFRPVGSFAYFLDQIIRRDHFSKFIFTCRPLIREAGVDFYQIRLNGLSEKECLELFHLYKITVKDEELKILSNKAHKITKGHPLWLSLIAGQAIRGIDTVNSFIDKIANKSSFNEDDFSSILSEKILDEVWKSLNVKQKTLIRGIAETVKPEIEENLKEILHSELNPNQFNRALKTLKNLNLVEILTGGEIELHPLVKGYVLTKYPKNERAKFITLFVKYYDRFIYVLKPNLNSKLTINDFQNWTSKIELQINKNDYKSALIALEEVGKSILAAGYTEEYLRVAEKLYQTINWESAISGEFSYFHSQFSLLCTTQTQMGKFELSLENLEKYSELIPGKSAYYLSYCSEKVYNLWFQKKYADAIYAGEEGEFLINESNLSDQFSLKHNLALARRDSNQVTNIQKALNYFLHNESLEKVLNKSRIDKELSGNFYGNTGKCLELLGQSENALFCYCVSLRFLLVEESTNAILNIGYACNWIGQLLIKSDNKKEGLYFLKYAMNSWEKTSPPRCKDAMENYNKVIFDQETKKQISNLSPWRIENFCEKHIGNIII